MKIKNYRYDPSWRLTYEQIAAKIYRKLSIKGLDPKMAHIGSTAIKNMFSSGVIDLLLGVRTEEDTSVYIEQLLAMSLIHDLSYSSSIEKCQKFYKVKAFNPLQNIPSKIIIETGHYPRTDRFQHLYHIYLCHSNSTEYLDYLSWRDFLNKSPSLVESINYKKMHLTQQEWDKDHNYQAMKSSMIQEMKADNGFY